MHKTTQEGVNDRVAELEEAGIETWPARETMDVSGWLLRFSEGQTHRGNSVATHRFHGASADDAIAIVEGEYASRNLPPMFQISPAAKPRDLQETLERRGYKTITPTVTCVATSLVMRARLPEPREVRTGGEPDDAFADLILDNSRSQADGRERLEILSRIELPHICVTAYDKGVGVACGTGTFSKGWVGINLMRTNADYRRAGHAQRVLSAIARWAEGKGCARLYLNVEAGNTAARQLYTKAGFETAYEYHYAIRR